MRSLDPDSEENAEMTRDNQRAVFAAKMQYRADCGEFDPENEDCDHQYAEVLSGVKCIKCGHFVGNWE